jgi:Domain of unknown function (DUF4145)
MLLRNDNNPQDIFDRHFALRCHHCGIHSNISAVSVPRFEFLARFQPKTIGIAYRCDSCNFPVFLRFRVTQYDVGNHRIQLSDTFEEVERASETFDFQYLPATVADEFREALTCYSQSCYNAFAAMCRRCIQAAFTALGSAGKDRIVAQLKDVRDTAALDDETFEVLNQIVIAGHDGAHPHLPRLSPERAAVLLELMKDVLYQLFVRKAKIQEAIALRKQAIEDAKQKAR